MKKHNAHISPEFLSYIGEEFFREDPQELDDFIASIGKPLPKTIRVNTNRISIEDFKKLANKRSWKLTETINPQVFRIDRSDMSLALGATPEHLSGLFYIQELAASLSVYAFETHLSADERSGVHRVLDMSASPGGKTTQLAEVFPNSFVIANEPSRDRIPQLVENTERMGNLRIGITPYNGLVFEGLPEFFDYVLLDAPCSGEGTVFKNPGALEHWREKSVKTIARLQEKLLRSALTTLKVGGTLVYSTCTLNRFENEGVLNAIQQEFPGTFEIISQDRSWPHRGGTGGFFVSVLKKVASLPISKTLRVPKSSDHISLLGSSLPRTYAGLLHADHPVTYMAHGSSLLATDYKGNMAEILSAMSLIRCGMTVARTMGDGQVEYLYQSGRDDLYIGLGGYLLTPAQAVEWLYHSRLDTNALMPDLMAPVHGGSPWVILKSMDGYPLGLARRDRTEISARIPKEWIIKRIHST